MSEIINTGTVEATQEEVAAGQSEHDKAMLAKVDETEAKLTERPDWLPEKFKDAAQMAEAYAALETKLGQGGPSEETTEESSAAETESAPPVDTAPSEVRSCWSP